MLVAFALAVTATGCGGDDTVEGAAIDPAATTPAGTPVAGDPNSIATTPGTPVAGGATDASAADATSSDVPGANEIAGSDAAAGVEVKISAITPKQFKAAHCSKPILVAVHQPGSILDVKLLAQVQAAAAAGPKDAVLLTYTAKDVTKFGDLPAKLGLLSSPGVATVGRDGRIQNFWTTYVDSDLILASLENAADAKPCKLTAADVPVAGETTSDLGKAAALVAGTGTAPAPVDAVPTATTGTGVDSMIS